MQIFSSSGFVWLHVQSIFLQKLLSPSPYSCVRTLPAKSISKWILTCLILLQRMPALSLRNTGHSSTKTKDEIISYLSSFFLHLIVVRVSFYSLIKGITPKNRTLCFVPINGVILNLLCARFASCH